MRAIGWGATTTSTVLALAACSGHGHAVRSDAPVPSLATEPTSGAAASPTSTATAHDGAPKPSGSARTPAASHSGDPSSSPAAHGPRHPTATRPATHNAPPPATHTPAPEPSSHSSTPSRSPSAKPCAVTGTTAGLDIVEDPPQRGQFSPRTLTIGCGDAVTVSNGTAAAHTWSPTNGGFTGSGNLDTNATYTYTFRFAGSYGFVCDYHSYMTGTVTVS